jgi:hypothetical protein
MPSRGDVSIMIASNTKTVPMEHSIYPARSSSYRVYSVIDAYAYGGDPGIQFSPTAEEPPYDGMTGGQETMQRSRSDEPLTYEDIEEASDSDLVTMAAMVDDDYDPYRQVSPVGFGKTKKKREQLVQKVYDNQISQKQIEEFVRVQMATQEKALPATPPSPPEKEKVVVTKNRRDSAMSGSTLGKGEYLFSFSNHHLSRPSIFVLEG